MPNTKKTLTTMAGAAPLLAGLVVAGAAPAQALSVNINLGGNPSAKSASTATASPAAVSSYNTLNLSRAVQTPVATPVAVDGLTATTEANVDLSNLQNGDATADANVSIGSLLANAGSATLVTSGSVNADDLTGTGSTAADTDLNLALNPDSGSVGGGVVPTNPGTTTVPSVPNAPALSGTPNGAGAGVPSTGGSGSAGTSSSSQNASGSGSGAASASGSSNGSSATVTGTGAGSASTPGTGNGGGGGVVPPVVTVPCTSVNQVGDTVLVTVNGVVNTADQTNAAASLAATVLAKANINTCTVAIDLGVNGLLDLNSESIDPGNLVSLEDLDGADAGLVDVDLDLDQDDPTNSGITVNVNTDDVDTDSLLSVN